MLQGLEISLLVLLGLLGLEFKRFQLPELVLAHYVKQIGVFYLLHGRVGITNKRH